MDLSAQIVATNPKPQKAPATTSSKAARVCKLRPDSDMQNLEWCRLRRSRQRRRNPRGFRNEIVEFRSSIVIPAERVTPELSGRDGAASKSVDNHLVKRLGSFLDVFATLLFVDRVEFFEVSV
jgi:hypothetical protein